MAYTFKDSDADGTYFKDYNKVDGQQSVLVGNWYEERKLQEMTGHMRNSQWVAPSSISQQADFEPMHTKMKGHPDLEDTTMRVFFHSNYVAPAEVKPASKLFREDRWRKYEEPQKGARTALLERRARALALAQLEGEEIAAEERSRLAESEAKVSEAHANFVGHEPVAPEERGKRVMKTQDGDVAVRDPSFLVEVGLVEPHLALSASVANASTPAGAVSVATGLGMATTRGDMLPEPVTYVDRPDAFIPGQTKAKAAMVYAKTRNDEFSKPIEHSTKPGVWHDM